MSEKNKKPQVSETSVAEPLAAKPVDKKAQKVAHILRPVENEEGEVRLVAISLLEDVFPKLGQEQKVREGTSSDWNAVILEDDITVRGFRPQEGPEMSAFVDEPFLADGNTRCSAAVKVSKRNATLANIEIPIRFYPATTSREKRAEIRVRAVRLTREWTRADWIQAGVEICLAYPDGRITEATLLEKVGVERFMRQFSNALQVHKDEKTGRLVVDKVKNRQALQTLKRLAYELPRFCTALFINRLKGRMPSIGDQDLTALTSDWAEDVVANQKVEGVQTIDELIKIYPNSKLLARLGTISNEPSGKGRKGGVGAMRVDDLKSTKAKFAGGDLTRMAMSLAAREPGYATDDGQEDIKALDTLVRRTMTNPNLTLEELRTAQANYIALVDRIYDRGSKAATAATAALKAATEEEEKKGKKTT